MAISVAKALLLLLLHFCCTLDGISTVVPPTIRTVNGSCPSDHEATISLIRDDLLETVVSTLQHLRASCPCGAAGRWRRVAHLNMSDPAQDCPPNFILYDVSPIRGCQRPSNRPGFISAFYPPGGTYSKVCGQVTAYQKGNTNAFMLSIDNPSLTLDSDYIDGVSLTHGPDGSRSHIWSFVVGLSETRSSGYLSSDNCDCTNTDFSWPHTVPSFVGSDYFCATGNPGPVIDETQYYSDDPLWDGEGCGSTSTCCTFNNPPWFCKTLSEETNDNLELRICMDQTTANEDVVISLIDIYVQ